MLLPGVEIPIICRESVLTGPNFQAAANHFGCGSVTQTSDANQVVQALSEGHPVISSQRAGLFTSGGHFIVLRGVTADSKDFGQRSQ